MFLCVKRVLWNGCEWILLTLYSSFINKIILYSILLLVKKNCIIYPKAIGLLHLKEFISASNFYIIGWISFKIFIP